MKSKTLRVKPTVLFRIFRSPSGGPRPTTGVMISDMNGGGVQNELEGPSAYLWLLLDGRHSIGEAVNLCREEFKIPDPDFSGEARAFLSELLQARLIENVPRAKVPDPRFEAFRKLFLRLQRSKTKSKADPARANVRDSYPLKGDAPEFAPVKRHFANLLHGRGRIEIQRYRKHAKGDLFHFFVSTITWPGEAVGSTFGIGGARDIPSAAAAATAEAIERKLSGAPAPLGARARSFADLRKEHRRALDPRSIRFFASGQTAVRLGWAFNPGRATKLDWLPFEDATGDGSKILLPAAFDQMIQRLPVYFNNNSNGYAAGRGAAEAKLAAALELIERDHSLFYWRTRNTPALIELPKASGLRAHARGMRFFYLKSELATVTVLAVFLGQPSRGEPRFAVAASTRFTAGAAVEKACAELIAVIEYYKKLRKEGKETHYGRDFEKTIWTFADRADLYGRLPAKEAYDFLFRKPSRKIGLEEIPGQDFGGAKENLAALIDDFRRHGLRLYFREKTPRELRTEDFRVYRAFSPDLLTFDHAHLKRTLGHERYYRLPKTLGLAKKPRKPGQFNPWPHPFS